MDAREWQHTVNGQDFLISTAPGCLTIEFVQEAFDNPAMNWTKPSSAANTQRLLDHSCTLGVFRMLDGARTPIGMARMVTDYTTLAYLTDVYIVEEYRSIGLGKWLMSACRDIFEAVPDLRWAVLFAGPEHMQRFYRRELGMEVMGTRHDETLVAMGARKAHLQTAGLSRAPSV